MLPEGRWLEFLMAAVLALVVVGPKDLPVLLRRLGQFMARVRSMAAEFRASFDEMARQSELDELRKEVEAMRKAQAGDLAALAAAPEVQQTFNDLSQGLTDVGVNLDSPTAYPYTMAQTEHVEPIPEPSAKPKRARKTSAAKPVKTAATKPAAPTKRVAKASPAKSTKAAAKPAAKAPARKPAPKTEPTVAPARRRKSGGTVA
jgi:sec-independent protein translocase protein TatB